MRIGRGPKLERLDGTGRIVITNGHRRLALFKRPPVGSAIRTPPGTARRAAAVIGRATIRGSGKPHRLQPPEGAPVSACAAGGRGHASPARRAGAERPSHRSGERHALHRQGHPRRAEPCRREQGVIQGHPPTHGHGARHSRDPAVQERPEARRQEKPAGRKHSHQPVSEPEAGKALPREQAAEPETADEQEAAATRADRQPAPEGPEGNQPRRKHPTQSGRIPDFPVTRSHPPASWPSAANSSICRTYRKTAGEESRRRSPVANRWMRP